MNSKLKLTIFDVITTYTAFFLDFLVIKIINDHESPYMKTYENLLCYN